MYIDLYLILVALSDISYLILLIDVAESRSSSDLAEAAERILALTAAAKRTCLSTSGLSRWL